MVSPSPPGLMMMLFAGPVCSKVWDGAVMEEARMGSFSFDAIHEAERKLAPWLKLPPLGHGSVLYRPPPCQVSSVCPRWRGLPVVPRTLEAGIQTWFMRNLPVEEGTLKAVIRTTGLAG